MLGHSDGQQRHVKGLKQCPERFRGDSGAMTWDTGLLGFVAGLVIAMFTAPVGVSGAVFLLPVQLSVLHIANPAVTPTNLLYNIVATPGALLRYARAGQLRSRLTGRLVLGTLPGVVAGATLRVFVVPGPTVFRLIIACVLLPLGIWLIARTVGRTATAASRAPGDRAITGLAMVVGLIGGIYGIGGGSILGPVLAGRGIPVPVVAPAALSSTFVTSIVGSGTYVLLSLIHSGSIAPDWMVGLLCGLGGLLGGYVGVRIQPHLPETALRVLLGSLAVAVGCLYALQVLT
jgi:uncharacterized protein